MRAVLFRETKLMDSSKPYTEEEIMIYFARMHVENALKEASKEVKLSKAFGYGRYNESTAEFKPTNDSVSLKESYGHGECSYIAIKVDMYSMMNAYPLENIK